MWADSFIIDDEPSELSQVNYPSSYQLFGNLGGHAQQPHNYATDQYMQQPSGSSLFAPQPRFPYEAWSDSNGEQMNSSFGAVSDGTEMWDQAPSNEQAFGTAMPQCMDPNPEDKSAVVAKIQSLTSENVTLDEEIEEQKRRNNLLMKRISEVQAQLSSMQQSAASLCNEWFALDETSEKFYKPLSQEEKKLKDIVGKKRAEIVEIKVDAERVPNLREEKDRVAAEIARLRDDLVDAEIDVDNLTTKFQYELGIMIVFPFWRLEEELDKALSEHGSTVDENSEEGSEGDDDDNEEGKSTSRSQENELEDSGEKPKENFEENFEERSEDIRKDNLSEEFSRTSEKASFNDSVQSGESRHTNGKSAPSASASVCSSSLSADESNVKTGCELDDIVIDESFSQNAAPKKQKKKISKATRFSRWLRRLWCIPEPTKDE